MKPTGPCNALVDFADVLPTLAELAGARLPEGYALDGTSFAPLLQGKPFPGREWIHSFLGTARWLRDQRWLLDGDGKFYDCGNSRDETAGYRDVTASTEPEVLAARSRFEAILKTIPAPDRNDPVIGPALIRFEQKVKGAGKTAKPSPAGQSKSELKGRSPDRPLIGAIRWDGWFKDNPWEKNSGPRNGGIGSHSLLPWRHRRSARVRGYSGGDGPGDRVCEGGRTQLLGLLLLPRQVPGADRCLQLRLAALSRQRRKKDLNFCLLLQGSAHLGPTNEWDATVAQFVSLFKEPTYQRVCGGRPLVYVYSCDKLIPHFGSAQAAGDAFRRLRVASEKGGAGVPYLVAQIWPHLATADFLDAVGFDALGAYSAQGNTNSGEPYAKLVEMNRWYWDQYKATGREVVPLVNAGWDGRPRNYPGAWYEPATPAEVADAVKGALDWNRANRDAAHAGTVLVYAWNEHDEGGWLCPTLNPDGTANTERLRALATVLKSDRLDGR